MNDAAGNTLNTALALDVLSSRPQSVIDEIGGSDFIDYYQFEIDENSTVSLSLSGLSQAADLYLVNSDGNRQLARSINSGTIDETIQINLKAGIYSFYISSGSQAETSYTVSASATSLGPVPKDEAGEIIDKAKDLGKLSSAEISNNEFIGNFQGLVQDSIDYYRFELTENSSVEIQLSDLEGNASLSLYNSDISRVLGQSFNSDNIDEAINQNLKAGIYYIRIDGGSNISTAYKLMAAATSLGPIPIDIAGDTLEQANDLGTLNDEAVSVQDYVGNFNGLSQDSNDYHRFELAENSTVNLELSGLSGNAALYLYSSDGGRAIAQSTNADNANEVISQNIKAGTYYARVVGNNISTDYTLKASATSLGPIPDDKAGETLERANDLGTLSNEAVSVQDYVGNFNGLSQDSNDYHRFELAENSTVNLELSGLSGNAALYLYSSDGGRAIAQSANAENADENITQNLKAGTYYARIVGNNISTDYTLKASATSLGPIPDDKAGETLERANDLGTLSDETVSVQDYVGNFNGLSQDSNDYHRFELSENSTVNLELSGLSGNAALYLYSSDGERAIAQSTNAENADENITQNLKAGTYYARIVGNSISTDYTLNASAASLGSIPDDAAGDTLETAKDLGVLGGNGVTHRDSIGNFNGLSQDSQDYYRFELTQSSSISFTLSGLNEAVSFAIYNSDRSRTVAQSPTSDEARTLTADLTAGFYYLYISGNSASTPYRLDGIAAPASVTINEPFASAADIGVINSTARKFSEATGTGNQSDYYKFALAENSTLNLKLSELSADGTLILYNNDGSREIARSSNSGTVNETIVRNLKKGGYYLRIVGANSSTAYQLEASAVSLGAIPGDVAGDVLERANDLGTLGSSAKTVNDFIGDFNGLSQDSSDYHKFVLAENSTLSAKLSGLSNDAVLILYSSDGREISRSSNAGNANEVIGRNLRADTYYLRVVSSSTIGTEYRLEASAVSLGAIPSDVAGDVLERANDLGTLGASAKTVNDFIGDFNGLSQDSSDYHKFVLAENSTLSAKLSGLSNDAVLILYSSDGREISRSSNAGNANEVIGRNLRADTYYLRVVSSSTIGTEYRLEASAVSLGAIPGDVAGDVLERANDLGILNADEKTVSDFIGNFNGLIRDNIDYHKFVLAENSTLSAKLSGLRDDAILILYNSDGRQIENSSNTGNADEAISRNLRADTYYLGVLDGATVGTEYQLEVAAVSLGAIPDDIAGDVLEQANDLGTLSAEVKEVSDFIGSFNGLARDSGDYHKFVLAENSTVGLNLTGLSDNAAMFLYNSDRTRAIESSTNADNADENISINLRAGTYYIYVDGGSGIAGTTYDLAASAVSLGPIPTDLADESIDEARDLGTLNSNLLTINDYIGNFNRLSSDFVDYYRFKLAENSEITLRLGGLTDNANIALFNSDGSRLIVSSSNAGSSNEEIKRFLKAGTYIFYITPSTGTTSTNYRLNASADSLGVYEDKAGDTIGTARNLGILNKSVQATDFIGDYFGLLQDRADVYRFEFKETSTLNLSLNRLSPDTNTFLQLLDGAGNVIQNANSNTLNTALVAGVYYFRVSSNGSEGTTYELTAAGAPIPDLAGNSVGQARDIGNLNGSRTFTDYIGDVDRDDFYRFDLQTKSSVTLNAAAETLGKPVSVRLLDSKGNFVTSATNGELSQDLAAGGYYAQVTGGDTYYDVAFSAVADDADPFQISRITPVEGSSSGQTTITVKGNQFTSAAQVSIIDREGTAFVADRVSVQNASTLTATFNLVGIAAGAYDIQVIDTAGSATAEDLFNVTATGEPGKLDVFISAPSALRPWSTGEVVVTYRNSGDSDITAPLLTLKAEGANFEEDGEYGDGTIQFLAINREGDAGVLPPGATGTFTAKFRPQPGITNIDFVVNSLATGETVDWNAIEDSSRPENIPVETWDVIFKNFTDEVGELAGQYEEVLAENASRLSELGEYTGDVSKLLSFELQQGNSQAIFERFTEGSFGRGWNNPWDVTATANSEGNVVVANGGSLRFFERQTDGRYIGEGGDTATLTRQGAGYLLREEDGSAIAFSENGRLASIVDTNGNEVVAGYTNNNLTTLTYSNGDVVTFAYNAAGKVREVTDPFGQKTTYTYDAANERLLSVTDESGTVSYTYETSGAKANAIKSITFPDGTQTLYEYDNQGRVIQESRNGGAEIVSYAYDSAGKVTVTDAAGNSAQLFQNADGQVSRTVDALGRTTAFRYDDSGNLTRITAPNNSVSTFNYDSRGNLLSSTDPLGQQVSFTYDSEFNQIQTVRDQRGNSIGYSYDEAGNLDGIVYADGSGESYRYNAKGEVTVSVNRRGEAINYSYDSRGLLTKKAFADGTEATFEYDTRGNLTKAVDADSSVVYAYDSANRLSQVTYGTGRFLQFAYDAGGRRSQMVDQDGFTTNYLYDNVGRLQQLTDKDNANVITYSYDSIGRLAREDNGNSTYTTYDYDTAGQLLSIVNYQPDGDINSRYDYTYDELGQRTSMTTLEGKTSYGYDATGQLTSVELPNGREITYQYDGAGNRISVTDDGVTTNYTTNNLNQYSTVGDATYTYDTDGNLISKVDGSDTWTYSYDIENRLIGVTTPDGTWAYEYDALGNRVASVEGASEQNI